MANIADTKTFGPTAVNELRVHYMRMVNLGGFPSGGLGTTLDSLGFAILVARLEDTLGFDPFTASDDVYFPVTLGDFIRVYENAAKTLEVTS